MKECFDINTHRIQTHDGRELTVRELMTEVKEKINSRPDLYDQRRMEPEPECETPGCIGGWMNYIIHGFKSPGTYPSFQDLHERVFGDYDFPWLFGPNFCGRMGNFYWGLGSSTPTPSVACEAIDIYLEQKGVV